MVVVVFPTPPFWFAIAIILPSHPKLKPKDTLIDSVKRLKLLGVINGFFVETVWKRKINDKNRLKDLNYKSSNETSVKLLSESSDKSEFNSIAYSPVSASSPILSMASTSPSLNFSKSSL